MLPSFSTIADDEKNGTHCPVNGHSNPDTQNAHAHSDPDDIAEAIRNTHMEIIDKIMQNFTSLAARNVFGRVNASGQMSIQQIP